MFIVFEGIDASGKTTTARLLAEHLQAVYYSTPPKEFMAQRDEVDLNADADTHYHFYRKGTHCASAEIESLLADGKVIVGDRYWVTTYIYHLVMGATVTRDDFSNIINPDVTVLLTVSPDEQIRRFAKRGMSIGDRRMFHQQERLSQEFETFLRNSAERLLVIDTSNLTPDEVVSHVLAELQTLR